MSLQPVDPEPAPDEFDMLAVLQALADPLRLQIVLRIAEAEDGVYCREFAQHLAKATRSYHLRILREAGITHTRRDHRYKIIRLRRDELNARFPGLIDAVIANGELDPAQPLLRAVA